MKEIKDNTDTMTLNYAIVDKQVYVKVIDLIKYLELDGQQELANKIAQSALNVKWE